MDPLILPAATKSQNIIECDIKQLLPYLKKATSPIAIQVSTDGGNEFTESSVHISLYTECQLDKLHVVPRHFTCNQVVFLKVFWAEIPEFCHGEECQLKVTHCKSKEEVRIQMLTLFSFL